MQLLLNGDLSPSLALNALELTPDITPVTSSFVVPAVSTQAPKLLATPRRVYTFTAAHERAHANPSLPTRVNTFPTTDTRGHGNSTLPAPFLPSQTLTSQPDNFPSWSLPFVASRHVYTRPIVSVRVPLSASSYTYAIPVTPTRFPLATSRVSSSFLDRPAMSSGASKIANPSITRNVYGSQPMVTSH